MYAMNILKTLVSYMCLILLASPFQMGRTVSKESNGHVKQFNWETRSWKQHSVYWSGEFMLRKLQNMVSETCLWVLNP